MAKFSWSPRVPKHLLWALYESEAAGRMDEDVLEEVGLYLYLRCKDIVAVQRLKTERMIRCQRCWSAGSERYFAAGDSHSDVARCETCGWEASLDEMLQASRRKQLNPGGAYPAFRRYADGFESARDGRARMILIDRLIHEFHYSMKQRPDLPTRPAAVNLIQGRRTDVLPFLDQLGDLHVSRDLNEIRGRWTKTRQAYASVDWKSLMAELKDEKANRRDPRRSS